MAGKSSNKKKSTSAKAQNRTQSYTEAEILDLLDARDKEEEQPAEEEPKSALQLSAKELEAVTAHISSSIRELLQAFQVAKDDQIAPVFSLFMLQLKRKEPKVPAAAVDGEVNAGDDSDEDDDSTTSTPSVTTQLLRHGDALAAETPISKPKANDVKRTPSNSTDRKRKRETENASTKQSAKKNKK